MTQDRVSNYPHWIGGRAVAGSFGSCRRRVQSFAGRGRGARGAGVRGRGRCRGARGARSLSGLGRDAGAQARARAVQVQGDHRVAAWRAGAAHRLRTRQAGQRRGRRSNPRPRSRRVRLRRAASDQGRIRRERRHGHRQLLAAAAAGRRRRHHAIQFSRHGAAVDVPGGAGVRQHVSCSSPPSAIRARHCC